MNNKRGALRERMGHTRSERNQDDDIETEEEDQIERNDIGDHDNECPKSKQIRQEAPDKMQEVKPGSDDSNR